MVMIPVGNRTRHNFSLWSVVEVYVRLCIAALLVSKLSEVGVIASTYWTAIIIFSLWAWRPLYIQLKYLYRSYQEAKLRNEVKEDLDVLSEKVE